MLHYKAIDPSTLDLLKQLLKIKVFSGLRLAGGTSLALQLGHRKSIDIDLFGTLSADNIAISDALRIFQYILLMELRLISLTTVIHGWPMLERRVESGWQRLRILLL